MLTPEKSFWDGFLAGFIKALAVVGIAACLVMLGYRTGLSAGKEDSAEYVARLEKARDGCASFVDKVDHQINGKPSIPIIRDCTTGGVNSPCISGAAGDVSIQYGDESPVARAK